MSAQPQARGPDAGTRRALLSHQRLRDTLNAPRTSAAHNRTAPHSVTTKSRIRRFGRGWPRRSACTVTVSDGSALPSVKLESSRSQPAPHTIPHKQARQNITLRTHLSTTWCQLSNPCRRCFPVASRRTARTDEGSSIRSSASVVDQVGNEAVTSFGTYEGGSRSAAPAGCLLTVGTAHAPYRRA